MKRGFCRLIRLIEDRNLHLGPWKDEKHFPSNSGVGILPVVKAWGNIWMSSEYVEKKYWKYELEISHKWPASPHWMFNFWSGPDRQNIEASCTLKHIALEISILFHSMPLMSLKLYADFSLDIRERREFISYIFNNMFPQLSRNLAENFYIFCYFYFCLRVSFTHFSGCIILWFCNLNSGLLS
jgi:hypothetical protein